MHSRKHGKSGSTKPLKKTVPSWVPYKPKEVEMLIAKLAKEGKTASTIGLILRDTYGIPDVKVLCKKSITKIFGENEIKSEMPEDLTALIKKMATISKHLDSNKKDQTAKHGLTLTTSKIKRLVKHFKRTGKLDEDWKFDPSRVGYFLE